jgi:DNA-binding IclR family transcriptional regulator
MEPTERNPVSKTLRALSWLVESSTPQIGVRQLAAAMKIAPSSAHRILVALSEAGFVRRDDGSQRYTLSVEFFRLSQRAVAKSLLRQAGLEAMQRLVNACHESALLGVYDDVRQEMIFAASVDAAHSSLHAISLNEWLPVRAGASGLAILAFLKDAERHAVLQRAALRAQPGGLFGEPERLEAELANVRRQGYAFTRCQWISGAVGLAAPIFNRRGKVIGDICVTIPEQRFGDGSKDRLVDAMQRCVNDVTKKMHGAEMSVEFA